MSADSVWARVKAASTPLRFRRNSSTRHRKCGVDRTGGRFPKAAPAREQEKRDRRHGRDPGHETLDVHELVREIADLDLETPCHQAGGGANRLVDLTGKPKDWCQPSVARS
jgi:hypothetical protein